MQEEQEAAIRYGGPGWHLLHRACQGLRAARMHSPLLLGHAPVDGNGWEVLFHQELGQGHAALH